MYSAALVAPLSVLVGGGEPMAATDFQHPLPNVHLEWKWVGALSTGYWRTANLPGNGTKEEYRLA
jgi:hypothetical protein